MSIEFPAYRFCVRHRQRKEGLLRNLENQWRTHFSRRFALRSLAGVLAGSPLLRAQVDPFRDHSRIPSLNELLTAFDFEPAAFAHVPRDVYDFMMGSSDDESTFRRNRQVFDWVTLVPRGIADVSSIDTSIELFGQKMRFPILVAPTSQQGPLHPEGEMGMHKGAAAANTTMIVSSAASNPIDRIAAASPGPLWFQLYRLDDIDSTLERMGRAEAAGCKVIAFTVDGPFGPYRERVLHDRHLSSTETGATPGDRSRTRQGTRINYGLGKGQVFDWKLVDTLKAATKLPFLLKGLQTHEDAAIALEHGVDGIIVSNHGARRVGHGCATLEALPEIVETVKDKIPVLIDSGFRRGSDVLKALAMGAKAVCLGRVPRWGLAGYGPVGVQRILEIVQSELVIAMADTGQASIAAIDRNLVKVDFA